MFGMPLEMMNCRPLSGHSNAPSIMSTSINTWCKFFRNSSSSPDLWASVNSLGMVFASPICSFGKKIRRESNEYWQVQWKNEVLRWNWWEKLDLQACLALKDEFKWSWKQTHSNFKAISVLKGKFKWISKQLRPHKQVHLDFQSFSASRSAFQSKIGFARGFNWISNQYRLDQSDFNWVSKQSRPIQSKFTWICKQFRICKQIQLNFQATPASQAGSNEFPSNFDLIKAKSLEFPHSFD